LGDSGQIEENTTPGYSSRQPVLILDGVTKIAASNSHSLAIRNPDGRVRPWGDNTHGQLGNLYVGYYTTPGEVWLP
jgi:alpha-tubulin suppressor-like RCC1 family protein